MKFFCSVESPIFWPPDAKIWLIGKDPDPGKDWRQEEKGTTEDEMIGWHHWLDGFEFEQALGAGEGQGSLLSRNPWGCKESDTTEPLNWTGNKLRNSVKIVFKTDSLNGYLNFKGIHPADNMILSVFP